MGKDGHRRHLSNYILDKSLQLRYVLFVTLVSAALFGALGYMVWQQENSATQNIVSTLEGSDFGSELKAEIIGELSKDDSSLVLTMAGGAVMMIVVLSGFLIVMTHKVAGPLYKVSRYFDEMADGKLSEVYPLRKGDQLADFYEKFKDMHDTLRARHKADVAALGRFLEACEDASGDVATKLDAAREYRARREAQLA